MRQTAFCFCVVFFLTLSASAEQTPSLDASEIDIQLKIVQKALSRVFSLKGAFYQDIQCDSTETSIQFAGTFEVKRKGKYRFMYTNPVGRLMVSDGIHAFVYDKPNQLVLPDHPVDEWLKSVSGFLLGGGDSFVAAQPVGTQLSEKGLGVFRLVPLESHPFIQQIWVTLSSKSPYIRRIIIVDTAGCIIRTTFEDVHINTGIKANRFRFIPPKNAIILTP